MKLCGYLPCFTASFLFYSVVSFPAQAQMEIDSDTTMSMPTRVDKVGDVFEITGGTSAGSNLFHSFAKFSVPEGNTALFINNNGGIQNVIGRVTGMNPSEILGQLKAGGSSPVFNLFLLNPNGIIFGPNASLSLNGSFVATTADAIQFGNQGFFNASSPNNPSLLTVDPSAFLFNRIASQRKSITNSSRRIIGFDESDNPIFDGLRVPASKSLLFVGGDVNLNGGILTAPNGRVELGGLAEAGTVGLNIDGDKLSLSFPNGVERANVFLNNEAKIDVSDRGSGSITINTRNIEIAGVSGLYSGILKGLVSDGRNPGAITLDATETVRITDSFVDSFVGDNASGNSGDVFIRAKNLDIVGASQIDSLISQENGQGNSGNIIIDVSDQVVLRAKSEGETSPLVTTSTLPGVESQSGNITIKARSLSLSDGAGILTSTFGKGDAGDIVIRVDDAVSLEKSANYQSEIRTAVEPGAIGNGGKIDIQARSLSLKDGSQLLSAVVGSSDNEPGGQGKGGNIIINASDSVSISGTRNGFSSGIVAEMETGAEGNAGNIRITTRQLNIGDGGRVTVSSPDGKAGNLDITADSLSLNRGSITAETGVGQDEGANINLQVSDLLKLENESQISATADGTANGGNINIDTKFLIASPPEGSVGSDIIANAEQGNGGKININAQGIFGIEFRPASTPFNDITASSKFGLAGEVQLNLPDIDPSRGIDALPTNVIDSTTLIAQNPCKKGAESQFTVTGRGGLPPSINEDLSNEATQVGLVEPASTIRTEGQIQKLSLDTAKNQNPIVPAQGWVFNDKGEVVLTAYNPNVTESQRLQEKSNTCPVPASTQ